MRACFHTPHRTYGTFPFGRKATQSVRARKLLNLPFDVSDLLAGKLDAHLSHSLDCSAQCQSGVCLPQECCLVLPFKRVCFSWPAGV